MEKRKLKKICFINLSRYTWAINQRIKKTLEEYNKYLKAYCTPCLSLLTIAGITPRTIDISYIDEDFEKINFDIDYDIVGISAITQNVKRGYEVASEFRKRGIYVVMGGIHVSVLPDEALKWVDTVFIGEAENTWKQFLIDFKNKREKRIYKQEPDEIIDLTKSPIPRYDLLKGKNYFRDPRYYYNMVPIQVSRGCPHDCEFCLVTKIYGYKFRKKTIEQVKKEIIEIKKYLPHKVILFADDNLFVNKKYARALLGAIRELKIRWWAQTDISVGKDEELLKLSYESGGMIFLIGFESINPENLKSINKNSWKYRQLKNYSKYIENIQKNGINVFGSFIFGLDSDDKQVFKSVIDFMNNNKITGQLTIATPLPGSRMIERLRNQNRLIENDGFWDKCTFFDVLFKPNRMSIEELENGFIWAYRQIFNEQAFIERARYFKSIYQKI